MFNNVGFGEVQFNIIDRQVPWFPTGFAILDPNNYHLMYDTDIVPIEYIGEQHSYANNPWSPHAGFMAMDWLYTSDLNLYFAGADGYVYNFGVNDDDAGEQISSYYVSRAIDLGVKDRVKKVRWIDVDADLEPGTTLKIEYRVDNDEEWTELVETDLGSGRYLFVGMPKTLFRKIYIRFSNSSLGCRFNVNSFALDMVVHGQHKEMREYV
jgi:hypothetical protein